MTNGKTIIEPTAICSHSERACAGAALAVMIVGLTSVAYFDPAQTNIFPPCLFHLLTGLYCPGCGMTRGLHALLHGQIAAAAHYNLLLVFLIPLSSWFVMTLLAVVLKGKPLLHARIPRVLQLTLAIIVLGFWLVRNLNGYPFSLLAP